MVVNSLIEEIHLIFGEVSYTCVCATLMWSDKSSMRISKTNVKASVLYTHIHIYINMMQYVDALAGLLILNTIVHE